MTRIIVDTPIIVKTLHEHQKDFHPHPRNIATLDVLVCYDGCVYALRVDGFFDGTVFHDQPTVITMDEGVIVSIRHNNFSHTDRVYDNCVALPGMIDAHSHLVLNPATGLKTICDDTRIDQLKNNIVEHGLQALAVGITTVRDLGDYKYLTCQVKEDMRDQRFPRLLTSGPALTIPSGHCAFLGGIINSPTDITDTLHAHYCQGVDFIKVMVSGSMSADPSYSQFNKEYLNAIVTTANDFGMKIIAHAHSTQAIQNCIAAGVWGIEHCSFASPTGIEHRPDIIKQLLDTNINVGITIARPHEHMPTAAKATLPAYWSNIAFMNAQGIPLTFSSDAGINPTKTHNSLPRDLEFVAQQLDPLTALKGVSSIAARSCGQENTLGYLKPGYHADIVITRGNPLKNLTNLHNITSVYKSGTPVIEKADS